MMISISLLFNLLIIYYVNLVWGLGPLHICATLLEELWLTSVLLITEVNQSLQLEQNNNDNKMCTKTTRTTR